MSGETMIPILPCGAIDPVLEFYTDLGFDVTYRQKAPNVYAAVRRGGVDLHFYVVRGHVPANNHGTCAVVLDDPEALHAEFGERLKAERGRVPLAGIPRLARWRKGQTRFNLVDPAGNYIRFISRAEHERGYSGPPPAEAGRSRLAEGLEVARTLRDSSGDDDKAARVLDVALGRPEPAPVRDRARAIVARAEIAAVHGDETTLAAMRTAFDELTLGEEDRQALREEIAELTALEATAGA